MTAETTSNDVQENALAHHWVVQSDLDRVLAINRSGRLQAEHHILRRGTIGLGYNIGALDGRILAKKDSRDNRGHDCTYVQAFNWNAGN